MTNFDNKCSILAELWMNYRGDDEFADFIEYNDLGLPLAYMIAEELVKPTELAQNYINETFALFIAALGFDDDEGYTSLDEMFDKTKG